MNYNEQGISAQAVARMDEKSFASQKWNSTSWKHAVGMAAGFSFLEGRELPNVNRAGAVALIEKALTFVEASSHRYHHNIVWACYKKDPEKLYRAAKQVCQLYHQNPKRDLGLDELKKLLEDT